MLKDKYLYRVRWSEEDDEYIGLCAEFPTLSWLASTPEAAFRGIRMVVSTSVDDMRRNNEKVPEPIATRKYSGKFLVRVPPHVHRKLVQEASESNVSLNRLINAKLAD
jgi:predicted HicB family RNase H-like nuclease